VIPAGTIVHALNYPSQFSNELVAHLLPLSTSTHTKVNLCSDVHTSLIWCGADVLRGSQIIYFFKKISNIKKYQEEKSLAFQVTTNQPNL
jgi:hypothetical protein